MTAPMLPPPVAQLSPSAVERVEAYLQAQFRGRIDGLGLIASQGGVVLRGRSRTYHARQLAQHMVMETFNLAVVANDIIVK